MSMVVVIKRGVEVVTDEDCVDIGENQD